MPRQQGIMSAYQLGPHTHQGESQGGILNHTLLNLNRIIWLGARVELAGLVRNNNWQTFDATAITSAVAKFIIVHARCEIPLGGSSYIEFCQNIVVENPEAESGDSKCAGQTGTDYANCTVKLDAGQIFKYRSSGGTVTVWCVGYIE